MSAVDAQEQINLTLLDEQLIFAIPDLKSDEMVREQSAQFIREVGSLAIQGSELDDRTERLDADHIYSLEHAIQAAAEGNQSARRMIETNVSTDVIERTIKAGHVMSVELTVDETGHIVQHGQSLSSVQANSLRFASHNPQMRERVVAETRNAFRLSKQYELGYLRDYSFVVFSPAADNMAKKEMVDAGFFTDTMSCAIQVTSLKEDKLVTESAFVAGTKQVDAGRYDLLAIDNLCRKLGLDFSDKSAAQIIDTPILVHNSLLPNGAIDLVKLYDDAVDEETRGQNSFFGEPKGKQDYPEFKHSCELRELQFIPKINQITDELINEASAITSPIMAIERLHKLSEKHMVEYAVVDTSINADVFGSEASFHIEMARWHIENDNISQAQVEINLGKQTARSNSCPSGLSDKEYSSEKGEDPNSSSDTCEFVSKECPQCHAKKVKTSVSKTPNGMKIIKGSCGCSKVFKP